MEITLIQQIFVNFTIFSLFVVVVTTGYVSFKERDDQERGIIKSKGFILFEKFVNYYYKITLMIFVLTIFFCAEHITTSIFGLKIPYPK